MKKSIKDLILILLELHQKNLVGYEKKIKVFYEMIYFDQSLTKDFSIDWTNLTRF